MRKRSLAARFISCVGLAVVLLIFATIPLAGSVKATELLDVIFVLDNSGSMRTNDPQFLTRKAVKHFASTLAEDTGIEGRIAIVVFDGEARLVRGLTEIESGQNDSLLESTLDQLDFSGQRTNSPAGIERALYEFTQNGRQGASRAIILLSDGKIDTGDSQKDIEVARWLREDLADESKASDVHIFGVAFTEAADYQLMQALARRTDARYYRAFEASELKDVVDDVLARVAEEDFNAIALTNTAPLDVEIPTTETTETTDTTTPPPVSAAPLTASEDRGIGIFALLPVALLLAGGALLWRQRSVGKAIDAPPAQLLDIAGHLGIAGHPIELSGSITRIGRDPHNDIVLEDDTISSEHAVIEVRGGRYWIEDQRSTNGTRVGDDRVAVGERIQLKGGDHIQLADIDLMFVLAGYMPGGATVFLSTPPASHSLSAESEPALESKSLPPAMIDVDSQEAALAEAEASPELDREDEGSPEQENPAQRGQLSLLRTPDEPLEETDPSRLAEATNEIETVRQTLDYHLRMVGEISPAFASFVDRAFDDELRSALVVTARDLAATANETDRIQQKEYTFERIRFAICGVPGEMEDACDRFVESYGGFTRMLSELLQSESFRKDRCEILAVLSAGGGDSPWVSLSIVPDDDQDPRIDLLSYEFLTPAERQEIESNEHIEVSHSGFA